MRSKSVVCMQTEQMVDRQEVAGAGVLLVWPPPWIWPLSDMRGRPRPLAPVRETSVEATLFSDILLLLPVYRYFITMGTKSNTNLS